MRVFLRKNNDNQILNDLTPVFDTNIGVIVKSTYGDLEADTSIYYAETDTNISEKEFSPGFYVYASSMTVVIDLPLEEIRDNKDQWWFSDNLNEFRIGYFTTYKSLMTSEPKKLKGIEVLHIKDFDSYKTLLYTIQEVSGELTDRYEVVGGSAVVSQHAHISGFCEIYGPCYIGPEVSIVNSIVYPGTFIYGDSIISDAELKGSFVQDSRITKSTVHNSLVSGAELTDTDMEGSVLTQGSKLIGKKRK